MQNIRSVIRLPLIWGLASVLTCVACGGFSKGASRAALTDTAPPDSDAQQHGAGDCTADPLTSAVATDGLRLEQTLPALTEGDGAAQHYTLVLAKGQGVTIEMQGDGVVAKLQLYGPGRRGVQRKSAAEGPSGPARLDYTADLAGAYIVVVDDASRRGALAYDLNVSCTAKCELRSTRYPVILVHGFSGFRKLKDLEYFSNVQETWSKAGFDLHAARLSPYNTSETRGVELARFIDGVIASTFSYKVNLIAHSQGGIDARYLISALGYGDRIGALVTIATPHHGTEIADEALENPVVMTVFKAMFNTLGTISETPEQQHDLEAALASLSTEAMAVFNTKYPDDPRVHYESWSGHACPSPCIPPLQSFLGPTFKIIEQRRERAGEPGDNDGVVPTPSAVWSGYQGQLEADHFRQVGHLNSGAGDFDHLAFYGRVLRSMTAKGF